MTATQFYELSCDAPDCSERISGSGAPGEVVLLRDMRDWAAEQGWSHRTRRVGELFRVEDLCPRHTVEAARP